MNKCWRTIVENKEITLGLLVTIFSLLLFSIFPSQGFFQELTKAIFFLFLIPWLFIRLILKKKITSFGFSFGKIEANLKEGLVILIIYIAFAYALIDFTDFARKYSVPTLAQENIGFFLFYQLILVNFIFFFQEYFFKGFFITLLRPLTGWWSILIQSAVYLLPLFIISNNFWQIIPAALVSILGGFLAYRGKSFFYSYVSGLIFFIILDLWIIYLV